MLEDLCKKGYLISENSGRWTTYHLNKNFNVDTSNVDTSNVDTLNVDTITGVFRLALYKSFQKMNTFKTINIEYLRASRTIETVLVAGNNLDKIYFIYNYEGNSYRVFENHLSLIHFFQDKSESDFHFSSEEELDLFLSEVKITA